MTIASNWAIFMMALLNLPAVAMRTETAKASDGEAGQGCKVAMEVFSTPSAIPCDLHGGGCGTDDKALVMFQDAVRDAIMPIVEEAFAKIDTVGACGITGTMALNTWVHEMGKDGNDCKPIPTTDVDIKCDTKSSATDRKEAQKERIEKTRHSSTFHKHIKKGIFDAFNPANSQESSAITEARKRLVQAMETHGMEVAWSTDQRSLGKQIRLSYAGGGLNGQWEIVDVGGGDSEYWQLAKGTFVRYENPAKIRIEICKAYLQPWKLVSKQAKLQYWNLVFQGTDLFQEKEVGDCD